MKKTHRKIKRHPQGMSKIGKIPQASSRRDFVREFAPSYKLPTGKDGAMLRTQRHTSPCEIHHTRQQKNTTETATCDKAGSPNDVCPHGQVMSASPNDVANGCDVAPSAQWANIRSLATIGSNIIMSEASNIIFA